MKKTSRTDSVSIGVLRSQGGEEYLTNNKKEEG